MNENAIKELIEENTEDLVAEQIARAMDALGLGSVDDFWSLGGCVEGVCDTMESLATINADLLAALQSIMVEYPDMCADANMCDDPHTLAKIERAREAIRKAEEQS